MVEQVHKYVTERDMETYQRTRNQQKAVRDALQSELKGMAEFVNVNGRLYRYGFVSRDNERTRRMLQQMFKTPESFGNAINFPVKTWDDIDSARLKLHFQSSRETVQPLAPVVHINDDTLSWLKGVYVSLHRLNDHWGTSAKRWDEVVVNADAVREVTEDDISTLRNMLLDLTTRVLSSLPVLPKWELKPRDVGHGVVETVFATLAHTRDVREVYMLMLRYLARSLLTNTFTPLPPGKHSTDKTHIREFIDAFYTTNEEMTRDWGRVPPEHQIPVTTTPSLVEFEKLVARTL